MKTKNCFDATIFLEPIFEQEYSEACNSALHNCRKKYNGYVPTLCMGEILSVGIRKSPNSLNNLASFMNKMMSKNHILILECDKLAIQIALDIMSENSYIKTHDALNIATTISNGLSGFVTLDNELIKNMKVVKLETISKKYNKNKIKVLHVKHI